MILSRLPAFLATVVQGVALSAAVALPGVAATMQAVYSGTVTDSFDQTGVFGAPGSSLDGASFTLTFRYDTTLGNFSASPTEQILLGGTGHGNTSPMTSAALTINGVTETMNPSTEGNIANTDTSAEGDTTTRALHIGIEFTTEYQFPGLIEKQMFWIGFLGSRDLSIGVPVDLTQPFTASVDPLNAEQFGGGEFLVSVFDYEINQQLKLASGSFSVSRLVVTNLAPVPLPAAMPLLAVALVGLGLAARRRRMA